MFNTDKMIENLCDAGRKRCSDKGIHLLTLRSNTFPYEFIDIFENGILFTLSTEIPNVKPRSMAYEQRTEYLSDVSKFRSKVHELMPHLINETFSIRYNYLATRLDSIPIISTVDLIDIIESCWEADPIKEVIEYWQFINHHLDDTIFQ